VKLVLLGGRSDTEAAEILEVPEGTLTSRLARGRAALLQRY
jgi:RNA polymerase sigma-70 factor (ECF subfamily)